MKRTKCYEHYPFSSVFLANLLQGMIYFLGALIISMIGYLWLMVYVSFVLALEVRLLRKSCINCYYYGKRCFSGKGKVSALFFKKGSTAQFNKEAIQFKDILPDFLISLAPVFIGIVLFIKSHDMILLALVFSLVLLAFPGTGFIRSTLACPFCKQRIIGCSAERLFHKTKK